MPILNLSSDIIDTRDIIERIEELEPDTANEELIELLNIMSDLQSADGGDEQWRGDWYPITLIRDSYFATYARELCEELGDIPRNLPDYIAIDWQATARNIQQDYTSIEINGATYWTR